MCLFKFVPEVALAQVLDDGPLLLVHALAPVLEKVLVERLLLRVVVLDHAAVERGDLKKNVFISCFASRF